MNELLIGRLTDKQTNNR